MFTLRDLDRGLPVRLQDDDVPPAEPSVTVVSGLLLAVAALLVLNALLGPLAFEVIRYHYSASMLAQGAGLDAVALLLVAPVAVVAARLVRRRPTAGLVLSLAPATFTAYMAPQYLIGPDYLGLPGNNERFVVLHLVMLVSALALLATAWSALRERALPPVTGRSVRHWSWVMAGVVAFIAVVRWLPALATLTSGRDLGAAWHDNPTAYLLVGLLDVGLVVPAAVAAGIGLRRGARWARLAAHAVVMWFALVPASVAAMAIAMVVRDVPDASPAAAYGFSIAAVIFMAAAAGLIRPVLRSDQPGITEPGVTATATTV